MRTSKMFLPMFSSLLLTLVFMSEGATQAVKAITGDSSRSYSTLYAFTGLPYGAYPASGVILDPGGNLYGTTYYGGDLACLRGNGQGCGTVFKLSPTGVETVLYSFTGGADGGYPYSSLVRDSAGNLYGTTAFRGNINCNPSAGCGVVFKLETSGKQTVLHTFAGQPDDGSLPGALILDAAGNLYGTTSQGGPSNYGIVFTVDSTGTETVLHSFSSSPDGAYAGAGLLRTSVGDLYGTTVYGGASGGGTAFKLAANGMETVLYSFGSTRDGAYPGSLIRDASGNLYGTTTVGGTFAHGTIFKLDPTGSESVLYSFRGDGDGASPNGVVRDAAGNLYGTTYGGTAIAFCGTVFKLDPTGKLTVLHTFTGGAEDGCSPVAGLVQDAAGNLYGTTRAKGRFGYGTVFRLTPR